MKEELGKLLLDGLLVAEDGRLVLHDCAHVGLECIHILDDDDPVLLRLIPVCIKLGGEVLYLVLQCSGRTDRVLWEDDCPASPWAPTGIPNLDWYSLSSSSLEG